MGSLSKGGRLLIGNAFLALVLGGFGAVGGLVAGIAVRVFRWVVGT